MTEELTIVETAPNEGSKIIEDIKTEPTPIETNVRTKGRGCNYR